MPQNTAAAVADDTDGKQQRGRPPAVEKAHKLPYSLLPSSPEDALIQHFYNQVPSGRGTQWLRDMTLIGVLARYPAAELRLEELREQMSAGGRNPSSAPKTGDN